MFKAKLLISLTREDITHVVNALQSADGFGNEIDGDLVIADNIVQQVLSFCTDGTKHFMVRPEDTDNIKWGDFGICDHCHTIRKMEDS